MFERIIAPLDGSRLSSHALPYATAIARKFGGEVILVRVVMQPALGYVPQPAGMLNPVAVNMLAGQAEQREVHSVAHAKRYLANQVKRLNGQGVNVSAHVLEGEAGPVIIDLAQKTSASMIVMMSHGRGWFKRAIMGSVTDEVIRHSRVPVLVIRPKETGK